jgi:hypothetical protein
MASTFFIIYSKLFCLIHLLPAGVVQYNRKIKHGIPTVIATKYTPIFLFLFIFFVC